MKTKFLYLLLFLGIILLFTQCQKDSLDPLANDSNGSKKTIVVASGDESDDQNDDENDDENDNESDDESGEQDNNQNEGENDDESDDESGEQDNYQNEGENDDESDDDSVDQNDDESDIEVVVESSVVQDLWAGAGKNDISKGIKAGTVSAEIIAPDILLVKYETESSWPLSEAHLWIGSSLTEIPKNAAPGKFPYKQELDFTCSAEFEVNLALLGIDYNNDPIYIAAHCVVGTENETAWAIGNYSFISLGVTQKWGWVFML